MAQGRKKTADPSEAAGGAAGAGRAETGSDAAAAGGQRADRSAGGGQGGDQGGEVTRGSGQGGGSPAWADLDYVRGLIEVVDSSGIDSLEITRSGTRIRISKTPPAAAGGPYYAPAPYPAPPQPALPQPASAGQSSATAGGPAGGGAAGDASSGAGGSGEGGGAAVDAGLVDVKSPMVGTFYRAPAPEAPPYVEVGTRVSKGQTLCILEAMKLMNELESEIEGVVREVLVENAEPVEYGQVLFRVDPNG